jgi:hypothetical protein
MKKSDILSDVKSDIDTKRVFKYVFVYSVDSGPFSFRLENTMWRAENAHRTDDSGLRSMPFAQSIVKDLLIVSLPRPLSFGCKLTLINNCPREDLTSCVLVVGL